MVMGSNPGYLLKSFLLYLQFALVLTLYCLLRNFAASFSALLPFRLKVFHFVPPWIHTFLPWINKITVVEFQASHLAQDSS